MNPRNIGRFPTDFMFQLTKDDCLRSQNATLNGKRGTHLKYLPYAFTENGIAMLSSVLRSETAIDVNIRIMRAFTAMRRFVSDHAGLVQRVGAIELKQLETDKRIDTVFDVLDRGNLLPSGILPAASRPTPPATPRRLPSCWQCCPERRRRRETQTLVKWAFRGVCPCPVLLHFFRNNVNVP